MKRDRSNNKWLTVIVMMQTLCLITLWGSGPSISPARADGIPDAGAQREQLIAQSKISNEKLDKILTLISSGDVKVTVRTPDELNKR